MAYTDIDKPSDYFNTSAVWSGDDSEHTISGIEHQPDFTWIKGVNIGTQHYLFDSVRGATKILISNGTNAEFTVAQTLKSWNSDGFVLGTSDDVNGSGRTYVAWNWKAGTSFTNDASATGIGTIDSTGSVSTDAGFSIVSYTSTGSNGSIKHGLSTTPSMIIFKRRSGDTENWVVYHKSLGATKNIKLNLTDAVSTSSTRFNDTSPTSSVFTVGTSGDTNGGTSPFIAYCFAEKKGYSKFGSYTGNGNVSGPMIWTGFSPAFLMIKQTAAANDWFMIDNKREPFNPNNVQLVANGTSASTNKGDLDLLSNGFKPRSSNAAWNENNAQYIYMAFAENPFVTSSGVPACAR